MRAIGVVKSDICRMFLGEILAITVLTAPPAFLVTGYVLKRITEAPYMAQQYAMDFRVVLYSTVIVLTCNILSGLLPLVFTLRRTPAEILSRSDAD